MEFYVCSIKIYLYQWNLDLFLLTLCILGNVEGIAGYGRQIFFLKTKKTILCILKGILPFKMHEIIFFQKA